MSRFERWWCAIVVPALVAAALGGCHEVTSVTPDPALPGEIVTIVGTGLAPRGETDRVLYDGVEAEVVSWAGTRIEVKVPAGKPDGTYPVVVEKAGEASDPVDHTVQGTSNLAIYNVRLVPNPNNVLSLTVEFETTQPAYPSAIVQGEDGLSFSVPSTGALTPQPATLHRVAVVGLHAQTDYAISPTAQAGGEVVVAAARLHTTSALPGFVAQMDVRVSDPAAMAPGYAVFPAHAGTLADGVIYGLDAAGRVVWYHHVGSRIDDLQQLSNGHFIYANLGNLFEIDLMGEVVNQFLFQSLGVLTLHHAIVELPNGNLMSFYPDLHEDILYPDGEIYDVVADGLIEFTRTGQTVALHPLWGALDPFRIPVESAFYTPLWDYLYGFPVYSLTGSNGIVFDPADGNIIVSMRSQTMVAKFDVSTNPPTLVWVIGEDFPGSTGDDDWPYLELVGPGRYPYLQHAPALLANGNVMMYDNGGGPPPQPFPPESRPVEYAIDLPTLTMTQAWDWVDPDWDPPLWSVFTGDADPLPGGTVLVADTGIWDGYPFGLRWCRYAEVRKSDQVKVFEVVVRDDVFPVTPYTGYDAKRITSFYPPVP